MIGGGQCVMTCGTTLMQLWSASNWDTCTLEVCIYRCNLILNIRHITLVCMQQVAEHTVMPTLVLAVAQFSWMTSGVPQVTAS